MTMLDSVPVFTVSRYDVPGDIWRGPYLKASVPLDRGQGRGTLYRGTLPRPVRWCPGDPVGLVNSVLMPS